MFLPFRFWFVHFLTFAILIPLSVSFFLHFFQFDEPLTAFQIKSKNSQSNENTLPLAAAFLASYTSTDLRGTLLKYADTDGIINQQAQENNPQNKLRIDNAKACSDFAEGDWSSAVTDQLNAYGAEHDRVFTLFGTDYTNVLSPAQNDRGKGLLESKSCSPHCSADCDMSNALVQKANDVRRYKEEQAEARIDARAQAISTEVHFEDGETESEESLLIWKGGSGRQTRALEDQSLMPWTTKNIAKGSTDVKYLKAMDKSQDNSQRWQFIKAYGNLMKIRSVESQKCIAVDMEKYGKRPVLVPCGEGTCEPTLDTTVEGRWAFQDTKAAKKKCHSLARMATDEENGNKCATEVAPFELVNLDDRTKTTHGKCVVTDSGVAHEDQQSMHFTYVSDRSIMHNRKNCETLLNQRGRVFSTFNYDHFGEIDGSSTQEAKSAVERCDEWFQKTSYRCEFAGKIRPSGTDPCKKKAQDAAVSCPPESLMEHKCLRNKCIFGDEGSCKDMQGNEMDAEGHNCAWYREQSPRVCGTMDITGTFEANKKCCACGGGAGAVCKYSDPIVSLGTWGILQHAKYTNEVLTYTPGQNDATGEAFDGYLSLTPFRPKDELGPIDEQRFIYKPLRPVVITDVKNVLEGDGPFHITIVGKIGSGQHHLALSLCMAIACTPDKCGGIDNRKECQDLAYTGHGQTRQALPLDQPASVTLSHTRSGADVRLKQIKNLTIEVAVPLQIIGEENLKGNEETELPLWQSLHDASVIVAAVDMSSTRIRLEDIHTMKRLRSLALKQKEPPTTIKEDPEVGLEEEVPDDDEKTQQWESRLVMAWTHANMVAPVAWTWDFQRYVQNEEEGTLDWYSEFASNFETVVEGKMERLFSRYNDEGLQVDNRVKSFHASCSAFGDDHKTRDPFEDAELGWFAFERGGQPEMPLPGRTRWSSNAWNSILGERSPLGNPMAETVRRAEGVQNSYASDIEKMVIANLQASAMNEAEVTKKMEQEAKEKAAQKQKEENDRTAASKAGAFVSNRFGSMLTAGKGYFTGASPPPRPRPNEPVKSNIFDEAAQSTKKAVEVLDAVFKQRNDLGGMIKVVVIGKTGVGKSTLIKTLFAGDSKEVPSAGTGRAKTKSVKAYTTTSINRGSPTSVHLFDTPGLFDAIDASDQVYLRMIDSALVCRGVSTYAEPNFAGKVHLWEEDFCDIQVKKHLDSSKLRDQHCAPGALQSAGLEGRTVETGFHKAVSSDAMKSIKSIVVPAGCEVLLGYEHSTSKHLKEAYRGKGGTSHNMAVVPRFPGLEEKNFMYDHQWMGEVSRQLDGLTPKMCAQACFNQISCQMWDSKLIPRRQTTEWKTHVIQNDKAHLSCLEPNAWKYQCRLFNTIPSSLSEPRTKDDILGDNCPDPNKLHVKQQEKVLSLCASAKAKDKNLELTCKALSVAGSMVPLTLEIQDLETNQHAAKNGRSEEKPSRHDAAGKANLWLYVMSAVEPTMRVLDREQINRFTEKFGAGLWHQTVIVLTFANRIAPDCYDKEDQVTALADREIWWRGVLKTLENFADLVCGETQQQTDDVDDSSNDVVLDHHRRRLLMEDSTPSAPVPEKSWEDDWNERKGKLEAAVLLRKTKAIPDDDSKTCGSDPETKLHKSSCTEHEVSISAFRRDMLLMPPPVTPDLCQCKQETSLSEQFEQVQAILCNDNTPCEVKAASPTERTITPDNAFCWVRTPIQCERAAEKWLNDHGGHLRINHVYDTTGIDHNFWLSAFSGQTSATMMQNNVFGCLLHEKKIKTRERWSIVMKHSTVYDLYFRYPVGKTPDSRSSNNPFFYNINEQRESAETTEILGSGGEGFKPVEGERWFRPDNFDCSETKQARENVLRGEDEEARNIAAQGMQTLMNELVFSKRLPDNMRDAMKNSGRIKECAFMGENTGSGNDSTMCTEYMAKWHNFRLQIVVHTIQELERDQTMFNNPYDTTEADLKDDIMTKNINLHASAFTDPIMARSFENKFANRAMDIKSLVLKKSLMHAAVKLNVDDSDYTSRADLIVAQFRKRGGLVNGLRYSKCDNKLPGNKEVLPKKDPRKYNCGRMQFGNHCQDCKTALTFLPIEKGEPRAKYNEKGREKNKLYWPKEYQSCEEYMEQSPTADVVGWAPFHETIFMGEAEYKKSVLRKFELCAILSAYKLQVMPAVSCSSYVSLLLPLFFPRSPNIILTLPCYSIFLYYLRSKISFPHILCRVTCSAIPTVTRIESALWISPLRPI